ncbi:MAG: Ig-like domain-containing protein [Planctomycetaceae bacterium]|nr:Ig-like domain-containing protein [Planctomycetaceae bacterium]
MLLGMLLALAQAAADPDQTPVLERLNVHRKAAGLEPVVADPWLTKGCAAHAAYLVKNVDHPSTQGLGLHSEDAKLPGYSKEGEKAGKASVIFLGKEGADAVDGWIGSLLHRIPLLQSRLRKVGYGLARGGPANVTVVLDATNGMSVGRDAPVVLYPADGQKDVPLRFSPEIPDPIPESVDKKAGYPVTAIFSEGALVKDVKASLKDAAGNDLSVWVSSPEKPAAADYQRNTVGIIAQEPLKPSTTYTATIAARVTGKAWLKTWSFTTAAP